MGSFRSVYNSAVGKFQVEARSLEAWHVIATSSKSLEAELLASRLNEVFGEVRAEIELTQVLVERG